MRGRNEGYRRHCNIALQHQFHPASTNTHLVFLNYFWTLRLPLYRRRFLTFPLGCSSQANWLNTYCCTWSSCKWLCTMSTVHPEVNHCMHVNFHQPLFMQCHTVFLIPAILTQCLTALVFILRWCFHFSLQPGRQYCKKEKIARNMTARVTRRGFPGGVYSMC